MPESVSKTSSRDKRTNEGEGHVRETSRPMTSAGTHSGFLALQRMLGNREVTQLLQSKMEGRTSASGHNRDAEQSERAAPTKLLIQANSEPGKALDESVRTSIERATGESLSEVRVHNGSASEAAAEGLGARAYTIGSDIHLGSEARRLNLLQRNRLLAHEAVHTVQQGGRPVPLRGEVAVSRPGDASEVEASKIAEGLSPGGSPLHVSPTLALRGQLRGGVARSSASRAPGPVIQRDLKKDYPVREGNFKLDLTTESHPGDKSGMSGTIKFKANEKAPDSKSIRILQVARVEDLSTGKEHVWTGGEANRNKIMTPKGIPGVQPGFFVDVLHSKRKPRTKKTDADVSPYYIDDYLALKDKNNKDGKKKGKAITEASIWDYPGSNAKMRFSFETVAKDSIGGHVYGTVMWGFTISDAAKGTVDHERAVGRNVTLKSTDIAIEKFNEFYKNPGSSKAP